MSNNEIDLKKCYITTLYGKPGSGKTSAIFELIKKFSKFCQLCFVFSGSSYDDTYSKVVGDKFVFPELNIEQLDKIVTILKYFVKQKKNIYTLIVLDDLSGESWNHPVMKQLINNLRHAHIYLIIGIQHSRAFGAIGPNIRSNSNLIYIFKQDELSIKKQLWESYGGSLTFEEFTKKLDEYTNEQYYCMLINKSVQNTYSRYKAKLTGDFKFEQKIPEKK